MAIAVGEKVPAFTLPANNGESVSLKDYEGKNIILYFYPKDMTPGCTTQACDFRDYSEELEKHDAVILGVSPDPVARHEKFIEKYNLPFLLLSDEEHQVSELFDVWKLKKNFGKEYMGIVRSTFVIDKEGKLAKEWRKVKVADHVKEVFDYIAAELS
ncbi:peroxiredoxin [Alkalihalobacillus alcalophilus ATCC 27647 = CGMCC 1.3604]|uniref:thioredoxin-dependent peroxiredoxin n=1 Tax=Alkalihalobacillus alcalophilus ATCC 27647 = CGMCC 1.3604 TaxID=1218173 RepID=A0A094WLE1_ALKAL|nr:thioredoxin-dependent thiol peroxidase [Alkalihalobacillus alcalophilus]KGA97681.1 peroxiredoxin [Alkalihalobacillus alcalophilus ATCC 27647 = CGMCC 1.3604]MED1562554.1 thioredoxin-dependent thiol peroxidase [Alkalihalobacillus alcalophilus]THG91289.1 peroxiredoxin [Alkalihalobacillus alcalophilus ATCC 27647 = CGMCC 1.3604]